MRLSRRRTTGAVWRPPDGPPARPGAGPCRAYGRGGLEVAQLSCAIRTTRAHGAVNAAAGEIARLPTEWDRASPPDLWFCYHPYYKAPDLIGPPLRARFGIPYVTAEASYSMPPQRRRVGAGAGQCRRAVGRPRSTSASPAATSTDCAPVARRGSSICPPSSTPRLSRRRHRTRLRRPGHDRDDATRRQAGQLSACSPGARPTRATCPGGSSWSATDPAATWSCGLRGLPPDRVVSLAPASRAGRRPAILAEATSWSGPASASLWAGLSRGAGRRPPGRRAGHRRRPGGRARRQTAC